MNENKYFSAIAFIASKQNKENPCIIFGNKGLYPKYEEGCIISLFAFRSDDDIEECLCKISYERNGLLLQDDYCFGLDDEQDEYLYACVFDYCVGKEYTTKEELLNYIQHKIG